jgi:hypothetical protein
MTRTSAPTTIPVPRTEDSDAQIWAVNAALENGQTELAYELADRFLSA